MNCHVSQAQQPCGISASASPRQIKSPSAQPLLALFAVAIAVFCFFVPETNVVRAAGAGAIDDAWTVCPRHIEAAEARHDLPSHLLTAISKVESGRWHAASKANLAWPWTVMAEGKGRYLPSKTAAIAEVRALRAKGVKNIDVGCMQINLYYHPKAFASLDEAFDPERNTSYAASLLSKHRRTAGSWTRAIGDYHSKTIAFARIYRLKVFKAWRAERHAENQRLRAERVAQHKKLKADLRRTKQSKAGYPGAALPFSANGRRTATSATASAGLWR